MILTPSGDPRLPDDRPFTRAEALERGISTKHFAALARQGSIVSPLRGVWHVCDLDDGIELRVACVKVLCPPGAVVTDRTAGWLHRAPMVLAPGDHLRIPSLDVFCPEGERLRRGLIRSGERTFLPGEIVDIDGVAVTSKLRTTCDLGMQYPRREAFAGICAMLKVADFSRTDLMRQAELRFKGYRWVTQLRTLTPLARPEFGSPGECGLALCWEDEVTLPPYTPQFEVRGLYGPCFLDLAVPELRYAAEYDGVAWHGPDQQAHDQERRRYLCEEAGWIIDVFDQHDLTGPQASAGERLQQGIAQARRRIGSLSWTGQDRHADSTLIARSTSYTVIRPPGQRL